MQLSPEKSPSLFAQMVDKLRNKTEEELKMLYIKLFSNELKDEWKDVNTSTFQGNISEEEIIKAIQKNRYGNNDL